MIKKTLKNPDIRKGKPNLKLCPNHYHYTISRGRTWNSEMRGQAIRDNEGWYK